MRIRLLTLTAGVVALTIAACSSRPTEEAGKSAAAQSASSELSCQTASHPCAGAPSLGSGGVCVEHLRVASDVAAGGGPVVLSFYEGLAPVARYTGWDPSFAWHELTSRESVDLFGADSTATFTRSSGADAQLDELTYRLTVRRGAWADEFTGRLERTGGDVPETLAWDLECTRQAQRIP